MIKKKLNPKKLLDKICWLKMDHTSAFPRLHSFPGHSSSCVSPSLPLPWIDWLLPVFSGLTLQFRDGGVCITIRPCVCAYCDGLKGSLGPLGSTVAAASSPSEPEWLLVMPEALAQIPKCFGKWQQKQKHYDQKCSVQRWRPVPSKISSICAAKTLFA